MLQLELVAIVVSLAVAKPLMTRAPMTDERMEFQVAMGAGFCLQALQDL